MQALLQRISSAEVRVRGDVVGAIGRGVLVFFCAVKGDGEKDLAYVVKKIIQLRIFDDKAGNMNRSVAEIGGEVLVVSQFTLAANTRKGNRPSFDGAEAPGRAREFYERFVSALQGAGLPVRTGVFAEFMAVSLTNDGPVTILIDSRT